MRSVVISHKIMVESDGKVFNEDFEWKHAVVERPARAVVKLANIEDTSLLEDMAKVQRLAKEILKSQNGRSVIDSKENPDGVLEADGQTADDAKAVKEGKKGVESEIKSKEVKKRRTEVERLLENNKMKTNNDDLRKVLRNRKNYSFISKGKDVSFSVQRNHATSINWPQYISEEKHIGIATTAILDGVTGLIAKGVEVQCIKGADTQYAERERGGRIDDNFSVYLM